MKKIIVLMAAISILAVSCQKDSDTSAVKKIAVTLSATVDNESTRVDYTKEGNVYNGSWTIGDVVSVIVNDGFNANNAFTNTSGNEFEGTVTPWEGSKDIYGVYPYSSSPYTITDGILKDFDASVQEIIAGDAYYGSSLMVAETNGICNPMPGMSFKQAMAIVKIAISNVTAGAKVTKVAVINQTMYDNKTLVKKADIDMASGAITGTPTYTNNVVGNVTGAVAGEETVVNIALLPTSVGAKYSFVVTLDNGKVYKKTLPTSRTFARNTIYTLSYNLAAVSEEDLLLMVDYNIDNSAVDLSGYQRTLGGASDVQENNGLGCIAHIYDIDNVSTPNKCKSRYCENLYDYMKDGYTLEAWVYALSVPAVKHPSWSYVEYKFLASTQKCGWTFLIKGDRYCLSQNNGSWMDCNANSAYDAANPSWKHVIGKWDKALSKLVLYVDGTAAENVSELTGVSTMNTVHGSGAFPYTGIGAAAYNLQGGIVEMPLDGFMGPSRIWNRPLSDEEIALIFANSPTPAAPM